MANLAFGVGDSFGHGVLFNDGQGAERSRLYLPYVPPWATPVLGRLIFQSLADDARPSTNAPFGIVAAAPGQARQRAAGQQGSNIAAPAMLGLMRP